MPMTLEEAIEHLNEYLQTKTGGPVKRVSQNTYNLESG